jgi:cytochrome bd-type quinol oxidase subunit 2
MIWWVVGMVLAACYFIFVYRSFAGKVNVEKDGHEHGY